MASSAGRAGGGAVRGDRAGQRWPQSPAGLEGARFVVTVPVRDGLNRRPGWDLAGVVFLCRLPSGLKCRPGWSGCGAPDIPPHNNSPTERPKDPDGSAHRGPSVLQARHRTTPPGPLPAKVSPAKLQPGRRLRPSLSRGRRPEPGQIPARPALEATSGPRQKPQPSPPQPGRRLRRAQSVGEARPPGWNPYLFTACRRDGSAPEAFRGNRCDQLHIPPNVIKSR